MSERGPEGGGVGGGGVTGHRRPARGGQTMMGDSGREHVRCSKADRGEKRERRAIPSPQTQNGNGERHGQSGEVVLLPMSPTTPCSTRCPSRQAQVSPCSHPSPPAEGARVQGLGEKGCSQARSPLENGGLWGVEELLPTQ